MSLDERLSDLIKRIYCARDDAQAWDGVANDVISYVGGHAALTTLVDLGQCEYDSYRFYGPNNSQFAQGIEEYGQETYKDDPSLDWASLHPRARFCDSSRTGVVGDYLAHPYVRWNRARFGSTHWYVGYTPPEDQLSYSFSVHFPAEQGPGDPKALSLFRMLFDHMDCAMRMSRRRFNPESSRPLLLLDGSGRVREQSNGAQLLLSSSDAALLIVESRLKAAIARDQERLDSAVAQAASVMTSGVASVAVKLGCPAGRRPWILTVRPMLYSCGPFGKVVCELLVQIHPGLPSICSLTLLQSLYELTGRELHVVRLLADGHSIESLAECMGISRNTARTHLRSIFSKTGTNRQSELLQLCTGLAAA